MKNKRNIPPRLATRLLRSFLRKDLVEEVTADLYEQYNFMLQSSSLWRARFDYWRQVLNYVRPFAIGKMKSEHTSPYAMYKSYFKIAIRHIVRNKLHAFINIAGLSVGMAIVILIGLWIWDEFSYEKHFAKYDNIGRVIQHVVNNDEVQTWKGVPYPLAEELRKNYGSDFKNVVLTTGIYPQMLSTETMKVNKRGLFAEPAFLDVFNLNIVKGDRYGLLTSSNVILSESTATAFFGNQDPIGQIITIDRNMTARVVGIYQDIPSNSGFSDLQFIGSWELIYNAGEITSLKDPWRPNSFTIYVELEPHASFKSASARIKDAKLKKVNEFLAKMKPELFIHPMSRWHLYEEFENGVESGGRIYYIWLFGIIGVFVLLMACINFMNLSTARSEKRSKEIGIRKTIGSSWSQLVGQFFFESIITAIISLLISLFIILLTLPLFNEIADKQIQPDWDNVTLWVGGILFSVFIGMIAGSYPALYLSSIKPISAIKGLFKAGRVATLQRKVLVVVQFTVSVVLIVGTATVFLQIQHAKKRPLGYESNGLVATRTWSAAIHDHFDAVKNELENSGAIISMAESLSSTTESWSSSSGFDWRGKDPDLSIDFSTVGISYDYGKTIGWEIMDGRDFSRQFPSDSLALIINEAAADYMALKNPVGEIIRWNGEPHTVVGVIKNIIIRSPYEQVSPNIYYLSKGALPYTIFRIHPASSPTVALNEISKVCKKYNPEVPFNYEFIDEAYSRKFGNEERVGKLASIFSMLAIFISSLGIFGLSSFMAEQRTKEICVRKVMGASVFDLWNMMSLDFILLVTLSCIAATPIAHLLLSDWLEGFSYRIALPLWPFGAAAAGTLMITVITVSWHTIQAALTNPVKSLRTE